MSDAREQKWITEVFVRRTLEVSDGERRRRITVSIGKPARSGGHWRCKFEITGLGRRVRQNVGGIDGMQALMVCFLGIRNTLELCGLKLTVQEEVDWELLFPRWEPTYLGLPFLRRIQKIIDAEVEREFGRIDKQRPHSRKKGRARS
ncbi:MAG: hypothetical protein HY791_10190 [Deltaproteobacteria bacterium]|nr:hypothetical protein [Deltaproteobacteria bacterium]